MVRFKFSSEPHERYDKFASLFDSVHDAGIEGHAVTKQEAAMVLFVADNLSNENWRHFLSLPIDELLAIAKRLTGKFPKGDFDSYIAYREKNGSVRTAVVENNE